MVNDQSIASVEKSHAYSFISSDDIGYSNSFCDLEEREVIFLYFGY
jgi:hypothetical protein